MIYNSSETPVGISDTTNVDRLLGIGTNGTAKVVNISGGNKVVVSGDISTDHTSDTDEDDKVYSCKATDSLIKSKIVADADKDGSSVVGSDVLTYSCKAIKSLVAAAGGGGASVVGYGGGANRSHEYEAYHCKGTHDAIAADFNANLVKNASVASDVVDDDTKTYSCKATNTLVGRAQTTIIGADGVASSSNVYSASAVQALIGGTSSWEADGNDAIKPKNGKNIYAPEISGNLALTLQTTYQDNYHTGPTVSIIGHSYAEGSGGGTADPTILLGIDSGTSAAKISYNGGSTLSVNRALLCPSFYEDSDRSLKKNVAPISGSALSAAVSVPLVEFDWKSDDTHSYGTIAQECEKYMPEVVGMDADGKKSVNYIALLCAKVAALENEVAYLKTRVQ